MFRYIWHCGKKLAYIDMWPEDFDRLNYGDEDNRRSLIQQVNRKLGYDNNHTHVFTHTETFDNISVVIYECPCGGKIGSKQ